MHSCTPNSLLKIDQHLFILSGNQDKTETLLWVLLNHKPQGSEIFFWKCFKCTPKVIVHSRQGSLLSSFSFLPNPRSIFCVESSQALALLCFSACAIFCILLAAELFNFMFETVPPPSLRPFHAYAIKSTLEMWKVGRGGVLKKSLFMTFFFFTPFSITMYTMFIPWINWSTAS